MAINEQRLTADLLKPLQRPSAVWFLWVALLLGVVGAGAVGFGYQLWQGFGITGIKWPIYWGFFITNFVFWIGISHAGTLISAILRMVQAEWRRPVTRCAEVITAFALMIGGLFPIIHLGKPWLFFWLVPYPSSRLIWPNFRSPLVWDFFAISTYLSGSLLFLFLPMIPDFAIVRDHSTGMKKKIYGLLALGWRGPMWHSSIFGPYFVAGAIFSGLAGLLLAMTTLRKVLHLENYLKPVHFDNLAKLLLLMSLLWGYFTFNERIT